MSHSLLFVFVDAPAHFSFLRSAVRQFSVALATAGILPLINAVGVAAADAIFAVVAWFGFLYVHAFTLRLIGLSI